MKIEDLKGKAYNEVSESFDTELNEYRDNVNKVLDMKTLEDMEKELMTENDGIKEYLGSVQYPLPNGVDFDGEHYSKNKIAEAIIYFLNKNEVEWSYTLGLYELAKLWKNKDFTNITYNEFDSTLRILNQVKFKGYTEWRDILAINEYMKANHDAYTIDTAVLLLNHQKHQTILDRMQLIAKPEQINEMGLGPVTDGDMVVEA